MRLIPALIDLGRRKGKPSPTWSITKGCELDLTTMKLQSIREPLIVPTKQSKRGSAAKTKPNDFYDTVLYALSSDGPFLPHCLDLATAAKDLSAQKLLKEYIERPVFSQKGLHERGSLKPILVDGKLVKPTDWVVLTMDGKPIGTRPKLLAEIERRRDASQQEGEIGQDVFTGERGPIARLHPEITFGSNGGSTTNLSSTNEGGMEFHGDKQGLNAPMIVENATTYTSALNRQFRDAAFLTKTGAIALWPGEGTEHPLIPIVQAITTNYYKLRDAEAVNALWQQLQDLTELNTEIHMAALNHKQGRISIRGYQVLPAEAIRQNLLSFRDSFGIVRGIPTTFRWVVPHTTERGASTVSDVCLLDTAWAILTGGEYSPHLRTAIYSRLNQARLDGDWSTDDPFTNLYLRWIEVLDFRKESQMTTMNEEISERARAWIESAHHATRRELESRLLASQASLRTAWLHHPAYTWGRFLAVSCALKTYYHHLFHDGKKLPAPRDEALRRGISQPFAFVGSYRPERYLEQLTNRLNAHNTLLQTYQCLFDELSDPPPAARFTQQQSSIVRYGFIHQIKGIENARALKRSEWTEDESVAVGGPRVVADAPLN